MRISIFVCLASLAAAGTQALARTKPSDAVRKLILAATRKQAAGEYDAAREIVECGLAESPDCPYLVAALGSVQQDMGDYRLAERSYRRVLNASDGESESILRTRVVNNLATLYLETGPPSKANDLCRILQEVPLEELERYPADAAVVLNTLATLRHQQHRDADAEQMHRESVKWWRRAGGDTTVRLAEVNVNLGKISISTANVSKKRPASLDKLSPTAASAGAGSPVTNPASLQSPGYRMRVGEYRPRRTLREAGGRDRAE